MKKEHKYAQALRWVADGEDVQIQWGTDPYWYTLKGLDEVVNDEILRGNADYRFRIKPKTIHIGDREIEAPIKSGPGHFISDTGMALDWMGDHRDHPAYMDLQKQGRVFATEEAARAAQEAITALLTKEPS